jgi:hypothetical protein
MPNGADINWSLAGPQQNSMEPAANAFKAGQVADCLPMGDDANRRATTLAPRLNASNLQRPTQSGSPQHSVAAGRVGILQGQAGWLQNLEGSIQIAPRFGADGRLAMLKAQLDSLPDRERQAFILKARQGNEAFIHFLQGLRQYRPMDRLPMAQHVARMTGLLDRRQISADDVSDLGISRHLQKAMMFDAFLAAEQLRGGGEEARRSRLAREHFVAERLKNSGLTPTRPSTGGCAAESAPQIRYVGPAC